MSLNNILEYYLNKLIIIKKLMSQNNEQIKIAQELQDYLDEHKQKISDEIYKNISGMNLRQFVVNNNNFYKVTYITHNVRKYDQKYVRIEPEKKCTYVKIIISNVRSVCKITRTFAMRFIKIFQMETYMYMLE
jgi:regulator of sigma D